MVIGGRTTAHLVGFANSWSETPWADPDAEIWGMNALYKLAAKPEMQTAFTRWFQLHDVDVAHKDDLDGHLGWLKSVQFPIYIWPEFMDRWDIPYAVPYPKQEVLEHFGRYFTNTVSWMLALAILEDFKKIGVYGIDMAQDTEYQNQRPSCEYFLGWAQGAGIEVFLPTSSDLLKTPFLYGSENGGPMRAKMEARLKELTQRRNEMLNEQNQKGAQLQQVVGALEDTQYWLRAWSTPQIQGASNGSS